VGKTGRFKAFLARKNIVLSAKRYFIDAFGAIAVGLFASLLVGTILDTIGLHAHIPFLVELGGYAKAVTGPAMAVAIGYSLGAPPLVLGALTVVGHITAAPDMGGAGGPLAVLVTACVASEFGKAVSKETKVDLLVTPTVTILVGYGIALCTAPYIREGALYIGHLIQLATAQQPFLMGMLVAVLVGAALTGPVSSAAICAALGLGVTGLAGGAAMVGGCAQMVGFAVMSFPENRWGGLVSQGLGTAKLQLPNVVKNPRIWIGPLLASAACGALATTVFQLEMNGESIAAGMGTCGLVGPIGVITGWLNTGVFITARHWFSLAFLSVVLPAVLCFFFGWFFRKIKWIRPGDLTL